MARVSEAAAEGHVVETFFRETIALCAPLAERLKDAELISEVHATGNYSYTGDMTHGATSCCSAMRSRSSTGVLVGVMLAMQSAFAGAEAIDTALSNPADAPAALAKFDRDVRHGPREFSWFIYRMTSPTMRNLFMGPETRCA